MISQRFWSLGAVIPGHADGANPESTTTRRADMPEGGLCDSGFAALRRPGMTAQMLFFEAGAAPKRLRVGLAAAREEARARRRDGEEPMAETATHVFRVSLEEKLYRDIEIQSGKKLYDLAAAIVAAFGFFFDHPFGFYSLLEGNVEHSPVQYELFADLEDIGEPSTAGSVERTRVSTAFPEVGYKMTFLFDYGDGGSSGSR